MLKYHESDIRNIALVGHGPSGKTTLADALLFTAKAVDRRGSVDDGTSISDYDDEENKHHFSIDTSVLHLEYKGKHVNLLDTPGYPDFVGAALEALNAVETAAIVVIGRQRHRGQHPPDVPARPASAAWPACSSSTSWTPTTSTSPSCSPHIRETFGKSCVLFNVPVGLGPTFNGVVSVLDPPAQTPAGCPVDLAAAAPQLVDAIVEATRR